MKKTTFDIMRDGEELAMHLSELFAREAEDGLTDEVTEAAREAKEALAQYEGDLSEKYLCVDFAKGRAEQDIEALKAQVATFQRAIKSAQRTVDRCKELGVAIFHSRQDEAPRRLQGVDCTQGDVPQGRLVQAERAHASRRREGRGGGVPGGQGQAARMGGDSVTPGG